MYISSPNGILLRNGGHSVRVGHGLGPWVGLGQSFLIFGGLDWVETWLRDIFNVMKYSTVC